MMTRTHRGLWLAAFSYAVLSLHTNATAQTTTKADELMRMSQQFGIEQIAAKQEAENLARLLGWPIRTVHPDGTVVELMSVEDGRPNYYITHNLNAARSIRADRVWPGGAAGLSLNGMGVILGIWDGGTVRSTHQEYGGRATRRDTEAIGNHATHVGGTMIGGGVDPSAKGMSFAGTLHSWGWGSDSSEMSAAAAAGLRVSNHSYGSLSGWYQDGSTWYWYGTTSLSQSEDAGFGYYNSGARSWDQIAFNAPFYLIVKSAGNDRGDGPSTQPVSHQVRSGSSWVTSTTVRPKDGGTAGYDTISYSGVAKNILTVGAVSDVPNYTGPSSVTMSSFSGFGPADDGRIKPDIVGNGVNLRSSTSSSDTSYGSLSGTSMSSPNVSGGLGLLIQHYRSLNANQDMRAATLKGLVIHTADECGPNTGPDYMFGWGLVNIQAAAAVISNRASGASTIQEAVLDQGQTHTYNVYSGGAGPIRVTISWTDPAGTAPTMTLNNRTAKLVNDLDLRVVKGTAAPHMPWKLDPENPSAAATREDNDRDNVEQVLIEAPTAGVYQIRVSHKRATLTNASQAYSIIITGATTATPSLSALAVNPSSVIGGSNTTGTVTLADPAPVGGVLVSLSDSSVAIQTPDSVIVQQGSTSANFTIGTSPVAASATREVFATLGEVTRAVRLTLEPGARLDTFTATPTTVIGGNPVVGRITLTSPAVGSGAQISLTSSSTALVVPGSISIPAGQSSGEFTINTKPVGATYVRTVTASYQGVNRTVSITLNPGAALAGLSVNPSTVQGGQTSTGTVNLSGPAPAGGAVVTLSSGSSAITVPTSVTVPAGASSATFTITTVRVGATFTRYIYASKDDVTRSTTLTLTL